MNEFNGKTYVVTGAGSGIGREVAIALVRSGAQIVLGDRNAQGVHETANAIVPPAKAIPLAVDIGDPADCQRLSETAIAEFGKIDGLVCAAGIIFPTNVLDTGLEDWSRILGTNLTGTFLTVQAVARAMKSAESSGSIVTFSSGMILRGNPNSVAYSASKAGVIALTKSAAAQLGHMNIRVNCIAPGVVNTPMPPPGATEMGRAASVLGRHAEPDDISDVVLFLLSEASRYMTGQTVHVNGGSFMP